MQRVRANSRSDRNRFSLRRGISIWGLIGGIFFGGAFAAAGGLMIYFWAWPELQNGKASATWPDVPGKVIESEVVRGKDSEGHTQYHASVIYEYNVEEERFENDKVAFGGDWSSNRMAPAQKVVKKYPVGTELPIYYDADDPLNSVLEPGTTWMTYLPLGFASIFLLVGLAVLIPVFVMTLMTVVGLGVAVTKSTEDKNPYAADFNDHDREERPAHDDGFDL